jgi:DNA (cytosine-5)-methyltransferase 1
MARLSDRFDQPPADILGGVSDGAASAQRSAPIRDGMRQGLRYGSVCSGIEATTVAWRPLGLVPAWFAEIDPFCSALLAHHYPEVENLGDFTRIDDGYRAIDILVGGTPCQSFSVAGRRKGLDDARGNLALEFCRLAGRLRPRWIVWENVPGVLSSNGGRDFGSILGALAQLGYGCSWRVLDAQFFGVPQRRRRVFVVGHLGDWRRAAAVLLERESLCRDTPARRKARQGVAALTAHGVGTCSADDNQARAGHLIPFGGNNTSGPIAVATACNAHGGSMRSYFETETFCVEIAPALLAKANSSQDKSRETYVMNALLGEGMNAGEDGARGQAAVCVQEGQTGVRECWTAGSVRSGAPGSQAGGSLIRHGMAVRRLTPRECERLQGLPDDYTLIPYRGKPAADGLRYRAIGNSMAAPVMRWIGRRILDVNLLGQAG